MQEHINFLVWYISSLHTLLACIRSLPKFSYQLHWKHNKSYLWFCEVKKYFDLWFKDNEHIPWAYGFSQAVLIVPKSLKNYSSLESVDRYVQILNKLQIRENSEVKGYTYKRACSDKAILASLLIMATLYSLEGQKEQPTKLTSAKFQKQKLFCLLVFKFLNMI